MKHNYLEILGKAGIAWERGHDAKQEGRAQALGQLSVSIQVHDLMHRCWLYTLFVYSPLSHSNHGPTFGRAGTLPHSKPINYT